MQKHKKINFTNMNFQVKYVFFTIQSFNKLTNKLLIKHIIYQTLARR